MDDYDVSAALPVNAGYAIRTCLLFALLFGYSLNSLGQHHAAPDFSPTEPLKVSFSEFPPYGYTDTDGKAKGYIVDAVKEILVQLNWPFTIKSRPTARSYHQLKNGELDLWLGAIGVPTLQGYIMETKLPPRFNVSLYLWRIAGTPDASILPDDLQGQSLAVIAGFTYRGFINKLRDPIYNIKLHGSSNHTNAFKMLASGRVDYLLDYKQPVLVQLQRYPEVKLLKHHIQSREAGLIVSRNAANSRQIFDILEAAVRQRYWQDPPAIQ